MTAFKNILGIVALLLCATVTASPSVLSVSPSTDSATAPAIAPAITATVGSSVINNPLYVDYDTATTMIFADSGNPSANTIFSVASGLPVNHAIYQVVAYPFSSYTQAIESNTYSSLEPNGTFISSPGGLRGAKPAGPIQLPSNQTVITSANSGDGGTGWSVEFAFSTSYLGLNTSTDSADTGGMAGILLALMYQHATFTVFDVHGTLRQTASNWSTGYNHLNYGYGTVSYSAANAIASTSGIYLQPPDMQVQNYGFYALITLYPFRTTRRDYEVIYSCTAAYSWPVKNEYSLSDVTSGCGTLLYTSNGTDITPVFAYAPATSGTVTLVAFTTDGAGAYSRVDEFVPVTQSFLVGTSCTQ